MSSVRGMLRLDPEAEKQRTTIHSQYIEDHLDLSFGCTPSSGAVSSSMIGGTRV